MTRILSMVPLTLLLACSGGEAPTETPAAGEEAATPEAGPPPVFSLAWSEYPSWSVFGVADERGLIKAKEGEMGEIEKKWNVDIVLKQADYDACIGLYGSGQVDAAALTNMDSLPTALTKTTVGILPTSTSFGADALLTPKTITSLDQLKGKDIRGLALSVSEYTFVRNLELAGLDPKEFSFKNMDPAAAATAMQQKQEGVEAIVVWNPFVMQTLETRDDVHVLASSETIPGEIVDMIVASESSLDKPGGDRFAAALADAFYQISDAIEAPESREKTLVDLGAKFSNLDAKAMETVVAQTKFYKSSDEALALYNSPELKATMTKVVAFEVAQGMLKSEPKIGYGNKAATADAQFRFDPTYLELYATKK